MAPIKTKGLAHFTIPVTDTVRSQKFYEDVFGFSTFVRFDDSDISTQYSALRSIVMRSKNWKIKLPINEPASGLKNSQIQEYLFP